ncbi:MAG: carbohydrate ABC transporter permease [Anaerolineae bacterium]|nr:carbohydrate ABC transporter permease [Anaerolineae bacterium]
MGTITVVGRHRRDWRDWRYLTVRWTWRGLVYLCAIFIALVSVFPFLWTISTSLKVGQDVLTIPPKLIPNPMSWQNYVAVWKGFGGFLPFPRWLFNSTWLTSLNIVGELFFTAIAGFGFARFPFRLRNAMFVAMLATAIVPGMVRLLPRYMMFASWHWTNTYLPLIFPQWFGGMYLTFLFRQYFATIPRSLDESALVDGASYLDIFLRIILPLSRPVLATAAILAFMANWNNFLSPFIFLHSLEKYTLAVGLQFMKLSAHSGASKEPMLAAYSLIMAAPVVLTFFLFQRYLVQGIQLSAAKE